MWSGGLEILHNPWSWWQAGSSIVSVASDEPLNPFGPSTDSAQYFSMKTVWVRGWWLIVENSTVAHATQWPRLSGNTVASAFVSSSERKPRVGLCITLRKLHDRYQTVSMRIKQLYIQNTLWYYLNRAFLPWEMFLSHVVTQRWLASHDLICAVWADVSTREVAAAGSFIFWTH